MVTVALTSVPSRFDGLARRLKSILAQGPDRICLTIPHNYRRFPGWDGRLPHIPAGVDLLRGQDFGPATKFILAYSTFPDQDVLIADDDCDYRPGWLDAFRATRARHPNAAIAASSFDSARLGLPRGHKFVQGYAGMMVRPRWLGDISLSADDPAIWVDDIWLSAQLARAGRKIVECAAARRSVLAGSTADPLQDAIIDGQSRSDLNRRVAGRLRRTYGIWGEIDGP